MQPLPPKIPLAACLQSPDGALEPGAMRLMVGGRTCSAYASSPSDLGACKTNTDRAVAGSDFRLFTTGGMAFFGCGEVRLVLSSVEKPLFDHPRSILQRARVRGRPPIGALTRVRFEAARNWSCQCPGTIFRGVSFTIRKQHHGVHPAKCLVAPRVASNRKSP